MKEWTTINLPEREQFSYWREVICEAFITLTAERVSKGSFESSVMSKALGGITMVDVCSKAQEVNRGLREIAKTPLDYYFANIQLQGRCRVLQDGRETIVGPGDFSLVDTTRPYFLDFLNDWKVISFRFPRSMLYPLLSAPQTSTAVRICGTVGAGRVALNHLRELLALDEQDNGNAAEFFANSASIVIAAAVGVTPEAASGDREIIRKALRDAILRYVDAHLADPYLSAADVARSFRVSPRYVHKLLEEGGQSLGRMILERRLKQCARDLLCFRHRAISNIAYGWGFKDISHFNHTFNRQYGCSPRDWRKREVPV